MCGNEGLGALPSQMRAEPCHSRTRRARLGHLSTSCAVGGWRVGVATEWDGKGEAGHAGTWVFMQDG